MKGYRKAAPEDRFHFALTRITKYQTPKQLRRSAEREYGLSYEEALEMAYENVLEEARGALKGYRKPKPPAPTTEGEGR
jgi:hypothetical protein